METPPPLDSQDSDPWMYFGSFSRSEVESAAQLLRDNGVAFEIKEEEEQESYPEGGWTGPFALWVRHEHTEIASALLVPNFEKPK